MATSSLPQSPIVVNPNQLALDIVHRLNNYDPEAVRRTLEQVEAYFPQLQQTAAQRLSRLARVVGESFNHLAPDADVDAEVE